MDDINFYFNTDREYPRHIKGGLEFETCVKKIGDKDYFDPNGKIWLDVRYDKIAPYIQTKDSSISCSGKRYKGIEFITEKPFPIIDIINNETKIGGATFWLIKHVGRSCAKNESGQVTCGTHVHMSSSKYTKKRYPYFETVMRYLWMQYFQPYFMVTFYKHQKRYSNEFAEQTDVDDGGSKYVMFNTKHTKSYDSEWHFEFRGYGEMLNRWQEIDGCPCGRFTGHNYLKMLMNLWEATEQLHDRLNLENMSFVEITGDSGLETSEEETKLIQSLDELTKLVAVRRMIQKESPTYLGTSKKREIDIDDFIKKDDIESYQQAVIAFNKDAAKNKLWTFINFFPVYRMIFGKKYAKKYTSEWPIPKPIIKKGNTIVFRIHITWHPDLQEMMISALSNRPKLFTYHVNYLHRKKNEQYLIPIGNRIQTKNDGSYANVMSFEFDNNSDNSDHDEKSFIITFKKKRDKTIKEKDVGDFIYNTLVEGVRYELRLNTNMYNQTNRVIYRDLAQAAIQDLEENEDLAGGGYEDIIDIVNEKDRIGRDFRIHVDYNVNVNKTFKEEDGVTVIQKNIYNLKF